MRALLGIVLLFGLLLPWRVTAADTPGTSFRVIVHARNPVTRLDRRFVADAFLKKRTRWGDDSVIRPVDLGPKDSVRARFSSDVLDRSVAAVRRYWTQLVFSGRGVPPPELASEADIVKYVSTHPGAIGYVSSTVELGDAKVVPLK